MALGGPNCRGLPLLTPQPHPSGMTAVYRAGCAVSPYLPQPAGTGRVRPPSPGLWPMARLRWPVALGALLSRLVDALRKSNRFPFATEAFVRAGLARPRLPAVILAGSAGAGETTLLAAMAWEIRTRSVCKKPHRVSRQVRSVQCLHRLLSSPNDSGPADARRTMVLALWKISCHPRYGCGCYLESQPHPNGCALFPMNSGGRRTLQTSPVPPSCGMGRP